MTQEEQLDATLSQIVRAAQAGDPLRVHQLASGDDLLSAAAFVAPLSAVTADPEFAARLEAQLLERLARAHAASASTDASGRTAPDAAPFIRPRTTRHPARFGRLWPQGAAAAVVFLALGAGTLRVGATAAPGSPLFGLRRWENHLQVALAQGSGEQARLHLRFSAQALAAFQSDAARHGGDPATLDALTTLRQEEQAASTSLHSTVGGSEHDQLQAQLGQLQRETVRALQHVLPRLSWSDRVAGTQLLGVIHAPIPGIQSVRIVSGTPSSDRTQGPARPAAPLVLTITGSGFETGATIVVDGHVLDLITPATPTTVNAALPDALLTFRVAHTVAVSNPDGTLVQVEDVPLHSPSASSDSHDPGVEATAAPGNQPNSGSSGSRPSPGNGVGRHPPVTVTPGSGHDRSGTPTPNPSATPHGDGK